MRQSRLLLAAALSAFALPLSPPARAGATAAVGGTDADLAPHTLAEALALAYQTNPLLTGERAKLRATDENVPTALAGWRPQISVTGSWGAAVGRFEQSTQCGPQMAQPAPFQPLAPTMAAYQAACYRNGVVMPHVLNPPEYNSAAQYINAIKENRGVSSVQGTVTQYLYRGGRTTASTHQAVNSVYAERARLIAEEETVFTDTVNAYVSYVGDKQLLALDRANEQVLGDELRAINDRFRVGELTRTDVAQAQAALAQAIATRQTAEGNLQTARATFVRETGVEPPADLADPQPLRLPVKSDTEAAELAVVNNPNVTAALFAQAESKDAIDVAFSALGPQISLQGTGFQQNGQSLNKSSVYGAQGLVSLNLPIYQGGSEYAAVRQARQTYEQSIRQTEDAQRAAREQAVQAWDTLIAAGASIESSHVAVRSNEIALEGLEREALVGTATTQNVLIQQQSLLNTQIQLVQNLTNMVEASYSVASAIGRLTASDLGLAVPLYDETAYYNAVRNRLFGTGDYATKQPGR